MSAARAELGPGRWHFQHGPIDLVIGAFGHADAVSCALARAWRRFEGLLDELVHELPKLRAPVVHGQCELSGPVARRMWQACEPFAPQFVTPMAAVAGSVAQEIIASFDGDGIERAFVNNGGDIALCLSPGASIRVAICPDPDPRWRGLAADGGRGEHAAHDASDRGLADWLQIDSDSEVRGVATSGWRGRSLSLGIADAVTVLAATASQADAAATMIANAVDCEHPAIERRAASTLVDSSDLGERRATVSVGTLPPAAVAQALDRGAGLARDLAARGLIDSALLLLQGRSRIVANQ